MSYHRPLSQTEPLAEFLAENAATTARLSEKQPSAFSVRIVASAEHLLAFLRRLGGKGLDLFLRIDIFTPSWIFVLRTMLAAALALFLAYWLQLESPYSAVSTVLLVANANHGVVVAKGTWRVTGTVIGGIVSILMLGFAVQTPTLFVVCFALWLGLCTAAALLFRHFWGVGAAVAGYTIGLATSGSFDHPELSFDHAIGRVATVMLGVVCLSVVTALLTPRSTKLKLQGKFTGLVLAVNALVAANLPGRTGQGAVAGGPMAADMFVLDDLLELSAAESKDIALREVGVREGIAALFMALVGATEMQACPGEAHPLLEQANAIIEKALHEADAGLKSGPGGVATARLSVNIARHDLRNLFEQAEDLDAPGASDVLISLGRLVELLEDLQSALIGLSRLHSPKPHSVRRQFRFHRDYRAAIDNGLRTVLATLIGSALWVMLGWQSDALMLPIIGAYTVLLAMMGNPAAIAFEFAKGTAIAIPVAFLFKFFLLPHIDGFPLLLSMLIPFWMAGIYATTKLKYMAAGLGYVVAFNTLVGATNTMTFDVASYLNQAMHWLLGVAVVTLCFRILFPRNPAKDAQRIGRAIVADVRGLASVAKIPDRLAWEHLQHHRLSRIALTMKGNPAAAQRAVEGGLAALHVGRAILRIRAVRDDADIAGEARSFATNALDILTTRSTRSSPELEQPLGERVDRLLATHTEDRRLHQKIQLVAASWRNATALIDTHRDFFAINGTLRNAK
ncbi:FUSC family protein [Agrobacterium rhizogenes]|uniref:FUSC family protein n=1 Tax=Rhizobium rhizogenes TaxID=359 RepID=UPI001572AFCF|nr:FUSC family protein [Rhizobium rhizogenes]NTH16761.1 FUSC family protein [Rhizobium rhizogenes]